MITYCFTNLPGISPSDRYGILVCLSGEENIVRDLAKWFSEQTKNGENTNAFYELLNKSEIRVDVYCVEFFFYFLGLYLTSIAKSILETEVS